MQANRVVETGGQYSIGMILGIWALAAIPWESVSRIVKRRATPEIKDCPGLPDYHLNVQNDCLETDNFNKSIVVNMMIRNRMACFFSDHKPYRLECFNKGGKWELPLQTKTLPHALAETFHMPEGKIAEALTQVQAVQP